MKNKTYFSNHDCKAGPEDGCQACSQLHEGIIAVCRTCDSVFKDAVDKAFIKQTGECLRCDHVRSDI